MDRAYYTILALTALGFAYSFLRRKSPAQKKSVSGWVGLGVIGFLMLGLMLGGITRQETLTWVFGLALMVVIPAMFFLAIGSGIAKVFRRGRVKEEQTK